MITLFCFLGSVVVLFLVTYYFHTKVTLPRYDRLLIALKTGEAWTPTLTLIGRTAIPAHAIYRLLNDLEDEGLVVSELRPDGGPERGWRPRRFYRITEEGLSALEEQKELP